MSCKEKELYIYIYAGVFMATQEKILGCGVRLTIYSMALRFVSGPLTTALASLALGLRSHTLAIVIMQVIYIYM